MRDSPGMPCWRERRFSDPMTDGDKQKKQSADGRLGPELLIDALYSSRRRAEALKVDCSRSCMAVQGLYSCSTYDDVVSAAELLQNRVRSRRR